MPYTYPGQAFDHRLTPLKGWYRESALDAEVTPSTNVNINSTGAPLTSGLCVHATSWNTNPDPYGGLVDGPGTFVIEMGCGPAHGMPMFLWPNSTDPDISNPGVIPGDPAYGTAARPPAFLSVFPAVAGSAMPTNMMALVASGAYEFETTEFDTDQTYLSGQPLRSVTSNTNVAAGKLTNQRGPVTNGFTTTGVVQFVGNSSTVTNWDTIVGFVSRGTYKNANRVSSLAFWPQLVLGNR